MNISGKLKNDQKSDIGKKIVVTALLAGWVAFIWHNSMETAAISSVRSGYVTRAVNELLSGGGRIILYERSIRKAAHFLEYALEGGLVAALFGAYRLPARKNLCAGALLGLLTALTDETIQLFSAGRDASVLDVWLDFGGFAAGLTAGLLWGYVRKRIKT